MKGTFLTAFAVLAVSACASTPASAPMQTASAAETQTFRGQLKGCVPGEDVEVDGRKAKCLASKQVQIGVCSPADAKAGIPAKCTRFDEK